jgi:quinol monooxygenase YgiN
LVACTQSGIANALRALRRNSGTNLSSNRVESGMTVARAGKEEQLRKILVAMLSHALNGDADSVSSYESNNRGLFYFYEEQENQDALDRHKETLHYKQLAQSVRNFLEALLKSTYWILSVRSGAIYR